MDPTTDPTTRHLPRTPLPPRTYSARVTSLDLHVQVERPFSSYSVVANFGPHATGLHLGFASPEPAEVLAAAKKLLSAGVARRTIPTSSAETHAQELANLLRAAALAVS